MIPAEQSRRRLAQLVLIQLLFTGLAAGGMGIAKGLWMAAAAGCGGVAAIAGTLAGAWIAGLFQRANDQNAATVLGALYQSALVKMTVSVVLLVTAMLVFRFSPLAVIAGYLVAQAGYLFSRGYAPRRRG